MIELQSKTHRLRYASVSAAGQTLDVQLEQLKADGCAEIYCEKASGAQTDRCQLLRVLKAVAAGDVVMVTRIDRLARSTFDPFAVIKQVVDKDGSSARWPSHRPTRPPARAAR